MSSMLTRARLVARSHPIIRTVTLGAATVAIYVLFHPFYGVFNLIPSFAALLFWRSLWANLNGR